MLTIGSMVRKTLAVLMDCTEAELKASYSAYSFVLAASRMLRSNTVSGWSLASFSNGTVNSMLIVMPPRVMMTLLVVARRKEG